MLDIKSFPISPEDLRKTRPDIIVLELNSILDWYWIPDEITNQTTMQQIDYQEVIVGIKQIYLLIAKELKRINSMLELEPAEWEWEILQNIGQKYDILVSYLSDITSLIKEIIMSCEVEQIWTIKVLLDMLKKDSSSLYWEEFKRTFKALVNQKKISTKKTK